MTTPVRIANCSGFYGDRFTAMREQLDGGDIDYLTGDYLAELTMAILWKARAKDPESGYAVTFLHQIEDVLGTILDRGVKVVTNAGGLNPAGLAARLRALAERLGLAPRVFHVEGDDLRESLGRLQAGGQHLAHIETGEHLGDRVSDVANANAYLGSWGIVTALEQGADIVVCPRVTDAAVTLGPAAFHHGWKRHDWDRLAAGVVAGHVIECGCQATGGNYPFFDEIPDLREPGFPIVEIEDDGSFVVTKHPGTGGQVSVGTVTAQLVYEIDTPRYQTPDVVARFDMIRLDQEAPDRVRVSGVRGEPAPATAKVSMTLAGGYRNTFTFLLAGLQIPEKARLIEQALWHRLGGRDRFDRVAVELIRGDRPDPGSTEDSLARLRVTVMDRDRDLVGREFRQAAVELGLANYPGYFLDAPPGRGSSFVVNWPTLVPTETIDEIVIGPEGIETPVPPLEPGDVGHVDCPEVPSYTVPSGDNVLAPLGVAFGARSGDKGGTANVGVWARSSQGYAWLHEHLTVTRFRQLVPEAAELDVDRYELPRIRAVNFVVRGMLGLGVSSNTLLDPQAKSLGEYLRARVVDLPRTLVQQDAPASLVELAEVR